MEATVDSLLNQATLVLLDKLDKQNLDPNFLQNFFNSLGKKISFKASSVIPQPEKKETSKASSAATDSSKEYSLTEQIKKAYEELVTGESTYKQKYQKFMGDIFSKITFNINTDDLNAAIAKPPETQDSKKTTTEGRAKLIEDKDKPQKVILAGFTESAARALKGKFSDIFKGLFDKLKFDFEMPKKGIGLLGAGVALLLGGLAALVAGLMTDGPFKGLLKILSFSGLAGGIKLLEAAAKGFMASLKALIAAPVNLLRVAAKTIGKVFGKEAFKAVIKPIRAMTGIVTKIAAGIGRVFASIAKRIPILGAIISFGFAATRFKSGDTVGGIIDILSGLSNILMLAGVVFPPAIPIGLALSLGLDALNAFLDFKAGGASPEASQKKIGILKEWTLGLGKLLYKGIKYIPVLGPLIQAVEDMANGKWLDATYSLIRAIPGIGTLIDVINWFTEGQTETNIKEGLLNTGKTIGDWLNWLKENIWEKITGFVTGVFDGVKNWWNNLSWDPRSWVGAKPVNVETSKTERPSKAKNNTVSTPTTETESSINEQQSTSTSNSRSGRRRSKNTNNKEQILTPMAEGGIVTEAMPALVGEDGPEAIVPLQTGGVVTGPTQTLLGEAGAEAVIPLEKYFNGKDFALSNNTLESIASNTKDTNSSLKMLGEALFGLVTVLDKKLTGNSSTTNVFNSPASQNIPSAAEVASKSPNTIGNIRQRFRQMQFA